MTDLSIEQGQDRIAKRIARAGLCSRREAERWIEQGRVQLNGEYLTSPAVTVSDQDRVLVDGQPLPDIQPARLWMVHKPLGVIVSDHDPQGRQTLNSILPDTLPRVMAVGRLDINSEGLILITNDGALKRKLELPATGYQRHYRVRVHGLVRQDALNDLAQGVTIEGITYGSVMVEIEKTLGANAWLIFKLTEGKNREIRKLCAHLGLQVNRLIRLAYGPFTLGRLPKGGVKEVSQQELFDSTGMGTKPKKTWAKAKARGKKPGQKRKGKSKSSPGMM